MPVVYHLTNLLALLSDKLLEDHEPNSQGISKLPQRDLGKDTKPYEQTEEDNPPSTA